LVFSLSFRRKPESSLFKALQISWTPVFTGVTAQIQFFHTFPFSKGEKEESFSEGTPKSSPPFEKWRTGGISEPIFQKAKMIRKIYSLRGLPIIPPRLAAT
jgi:hypothetical protein